MQYFAVCTLHCTLVCDILCVTFYHLFVCLFVLSSFLGILSYCANFVFSCTSDSISGPRVLLSLILNKYAAVDKQLNVISRVQNT